MKEIAKFLCSIFGHKIHVRTGTITERQECLRCGKVWIFETRPAYGVGTSEAERVFSRHNDERIRADQKS